MLNIMKSTYYVYGTRKTRLLYSVLKKVDNIQQRAISILKFRKLLTSYLKY